MQLNPAVPDAVASHCINLEKLDLAGLNFVDDLLLVRLAENCPKLAYLNLKGCRQVGAQLINVSFRLTKNNTLKRTLK